MATSVNKIYNGNLYMDGGSLLGKFDEIELPVVKPKSSDHKPMGLPAEFKLPTGWEAMEAKIKWNSWYGDAMVKMADPTTPIQLQFRGSLEKWSGAGKTDETPLVYFMSALPTDFPGGSYKAQENAEFESMLNVLYYRIEDDGRVILEFDPLNAIYTVDGKDILVNYRNNLGI